MNIFRTLKQTAVILAVSISTLGFATTAHAQDQDTADSFQPQSMCPTSEPTNPSNYHLPTLRKGHYGMSVELLQSKLGIQADGCFGPGTDKTVKRFQTCKGLVVDGIVGRQTWDSLERDPSMSNCKASPSNTTTPNAKPSECGNSKCVVVDQDKNQILVYRWSTLQNSNGMVDNPSKLPKGIYVIGFKDREGTDDDHNRLWLDYYQSFYGDVAFHAIPIGKTSGRPIHSESYLGTDQKTSGGCIRLSESFAQWLFEFTSVGTKVVVI